MFKFVVYTDDLKGDYKVNETETSLRVVLKFQEDYIVQFMSPWKLVNTKIVTQYMATMEIDIPIRLPKN